MLDRLTGHRGEIEDIKFSPNGELIATASRDQSLRLWDWPGSELKMTFDTGGNPLENVEFHPSQNVIAVSSGGKRDRKVVLWNY